MKTKITHLSSVHPRYDTRIYLKECLSLSKNLDYEVSFIVADNLGYERKNNLVFYDVGKINSRLKRVFITTRKIYKKCIELDSDIYHFHDPELIPVGLKLKKKGKIVIFDIHENIYYQIKDKDYINKYIRNFIASAYKLYEKYALRKFDQLILAEDSYLNYYQNLSKNVDIILNLPDIKSLEPFFNLERKENGIFYVGSITENRGLDVIIKAIKLLEEENIDFFMHYIGPYNEKDLIKNKVSKLNNKHIKFYNSLPLTNALKYSIKSKVGLSILKPIKNYKESYSTKVFEYMALGLPVITSNFPLYKDIVEKYKCGICIDPENPNELAEAIKWILKNSDEAKNMGINGNKTVKEKYNWNIEESKLNYIYKRLINS